MSDDFELRIERVLRADAERADRSIDPVAIAEAATTAVRRTRWLEWRPAGWPAIRLLLVASILLLTALATLWLVTGGGLQRPSIVETVPSGDPSDQPLLAELAGRWIASSPDDLVIAGSTAVDPFVLGIEDVGGQAYLQPQDGQRETFLSNVTATGPDVLRFVKRPGPPESVSLSAEALGACAPGDEGSYGTTRSADGTLLTLEPLADACPSRAAVLARTWVRYLGGPSAGGTGVVDAMDRHFMVTLPRGSYETDHIPGAVNIHQAAPAFEFLAWKDPQGFNDPCDPIGKGRRPVADAADFVEYFRQLPGFTVDSVTDLEIGGRPAINLKLHANPDASCPAGWLVQWQPRELSGDRYWYLRPGDSDSLYLIDLADATLMFEVLAGPQSNLEDQIIPSIRLLEDGLPTSP